VTISVSTWAGARANTTNEGNTAQNRFATGDRNAAEKRLFCGRKAALLRQVMLRYVMFLANRLRFHHIPPRGRSYRNTLSSEPSAHEM